MLVEACICFQSHVDMGEKLESNIWLSHVHGWSGVQWVKALRHKKVIGSRTLIISFSENVSWVLYTENSIYSR